MLFNTIESDKLFVEHHQDLHCIFVISVMSHSIILQKKLTDITLVSVTSVYSGSETNNVVPIQDIL